MKPSSSGEVEKLDHSTWGTGQAGRTVERPSVYVLTALGFNALGALRMYTTWNECAVFLEKRIAIVLIQNWSICIQYM